ncbi:MAG: hypothetical protein HZC28_03925 [Spirochaetes bacterium]|nr:hypothetical protein [Spirochaetota bacterium]
MNLQAVKKATADITIKDRDTLRALASRVRAIADLPVMAERKRLWYAHNACKSERPMVLAFPEGAWGEMLTDSDCTCEDKLLRGWELSLRRKIYWFEHINDDNTIEPTFEIGWCVSQGGYGVDIKRTHGENRGSFTWEPPLKDLSNDLKKLHTREITVDRERTFSLLDLAQSIFGDILTPRIQGGFWWSLGLTNDAIQLVGIEGLMLTMYDNPGGLHALMSFLRDDRLNALSYLEREELLTINNENGYTGSGGVAYTHELPQKDNPSGTPVRMKDLWGFAESQETVGVSPEMFAEFILPYQVPLLEKFGLNCYGCCEPVDKRLKYILPIKNMRRISISPWSDQESCAEQMGNRYVFSRKPNPAMICAQFNEDEIRADIRRTLSIASECNLEIIMKDTHTVMHEPERITRWIKIVREEIECNSAR